MLFPICVFLFSAVLYLIFFSCDLLGFLAHISYLSKKDKLRWVISDVYRPVHWICNPFVDEVLRGLGTLERGFQILARLACRPHLASAGM